MANYIFNKIRQIKQSLTSNTDDKIEDLEARMKRSMVFELMRNEMLNSVLSCNEKGVTSEIIDGEEYIVSLTSHGVRIERVFQTIESIFRQTRKVNRVVLYLSRDEFQGKELPITLQKQMGRGLEIKYVKDIKSFTKLVPALRDYPESNIITVDDDYIYPLDMIDQLVRCHHCYPAAVCCRMSREISMKGKDRFDTYLSFEHVFGDVPLSSPRFLALGYGGVLYPPHSLHPDAIREDFFTMLCPYADDIWFKAMELLQGTQVVVLPGSKHEIAYYEDSTFQETGLWRINIDQQKNDKQLKAVFDHYHLYDALNEPNSCSAEHS